MPEIWRKAWWPKAWWPGRWRHFRFLVIGFPKAPVAQLDRVLPSEGRGHRFESCRARHYAGTRAIRASRGPRPTLRLQSMMVRASSNCRQVLWFIALVASTSLSFAQTGAHSITGDARVDRLLSQMALAEKPPLIHDGREDPATYQGQAGYIAGVPRLGIPGLRLADGPPGVLTRHPSQAETATMGVAATFDIRLAEQNGVVIGREAHALGIDVALQPYINIDRDLAWRRAYNTYGEDTLLTSEMGAAVIKGIQSQHVMAVAKHFIGYDTGATDVWMDEQTLHEIYLPPFEAAVKAGVAAVMCSYNHINGPYACGDRALLTGVLRGRLGFKGILISDWGATHSAEFMNDGLDMEMIDGPDSEGHQEPAFLGAQ